jgi:hypothetical protein
LERRDKKNVELLKIARKLHEKRMVIITDLNARPTGILLIPKFFSFSHDESLNCIPRIGQISLLETAIQSPKLALRKIG